MPPWLSPRPGTQQASNICLVNFNEMGDIFSRIRFYKGIFPNKSQLSFLNIILPVRQSKAKFPEFKNSCDTRNFITWVFQEFIP